MPGIRSSDALLHSPSTATRHPELHTLTGRAPGTGEFGSPLWPQCRGSAAPFVTTAVPDAPAANRNMLVFFYTESSCKINVVTATGTATSIQIRCARRLRKVDLRVLHAGFQRLCSSGRRSVFSVPSVCCVLWIASFLQIAGITKICIPSQKQ